MILKYGNYNVKDNIIIIGAGKRIKNDVIPALDATRKFRINAIFAKHAKKIYIKTKKYEVLSLKDISITDISNVHYIYIAIPPPSLIMVLQYLGSKNTSHIKLIIDTPFLQWKQRKNIYLLHNFKKIFVAEDAAFLPWISIVKKLVGQIKVITFDKSGFRYHAIATIKMLVNSEIITSAIKKEYCEFTEVEFKLKNGLNLTKASIIEPRNYSLGKIEILGSLALLTDEFKSPLRNFMPEISQGGCTGLIVLGKVFKFKKNEISLIGPVKENSTISSLTPELKRVGLMRLLIEIRSSPESVRSFYSSLSDTAIDELVHKFGHWVNVAKFINKYLAFFFKH
jgi:hypothetical protein